MEQIFREYDIRGKFPEELTPPVVRGLGYLLGKRIDGPVLVTYDPRSSSPQLFNWLVEGLNGAKVPVIFGGMVPTGLNYFGNFFPILVNQRPIQIKGGIQITGSHNPPKYNGFKITIDRRPFFGKELKELGKKLLKNMDKFPYSSSPRYKIGNLKEVYLNYLEGEFKGLKGMEVEAIFDPGNGAVGGILRQLLKRLKLKKWEIICEKPDGTFPCHHPDPSQSANLIKLKREMEKKGYRFGFAFDGDGDRLGMVERLSDGSFKNYYGDELLFIIASNLTFPRVIVDVKTSQRIIEKLRETGEVIISKTGHSNLKTLLYKTGADLAGEVSGHIFFYDRYIGADDGIYGMLRLLELIQKGIDFYHQLKQLPNMVISEEEKVEVKEEEKFKIVEEFRWKISKKWKELEVVEIIEVDGVRVHFPKGWGLVRASNTTPALTLRFEGENWEELKKIRSHLLSLLPLP